jgi:hypothetical protein
LIIPIHPEKNIWAKWALESKESEECRKKSLLFLLKKLLKNDKLKDVQEVKAFLRDPEEVKVKLILSNFQDIQK